MVTSTELKSANRDGVNLAYLDTGSGEPALVFIHGWCCNQTMWGEQTKAFAPKHRVIAVDLRGMGESDKPDQDYDIDAFGEDMTWLLNEIGLQRPVLIGHSMGGVITLNLLRRHPDIARAAVFVDAGIMPFPDEFQPLIAQMTQTIRDRAAAEHAELLELITDTGESGRNMNRPGLQRMLSLIAGGNVQYVLVTSFDRLTRSHEDFARLLERLDLHGVALVSIDESFDSRSRAGRSFMNVMARLGKSRQ